MCDCGELMVSLGVSQHIFYKLSRPRGYDVLATWGLLGKVASGEVVSPNLGRKCGFYLDLYVNGSFR